MTSPQHVYEIRPRNDHRGFDLISDVLPFGRLWYGESNAVNLNRDVSRRVRKIDIPAYAFQTNVAGSF